MAGESARFGVSEVKWGLYPLGGSAVRLPRQIPYTVAADLLLTGRHIKAPEAKELGLIGHVVPDGAALEKAHEIAGLIAANGPLAVQAVLRTIRDSEGLHENDTWKADAEVGPRSSPARTPRRARRPSWRSGRRSSTAAEPQRRAAQGPAERQRHGQHVLDVDALGSTYRVLERQQVATVLGEQRRGEGRSPRCGPTTGTWPQYSIPLAASLRSSLSSTGQREEVERRGAPPLHDGALQLEVEALSCDEYDPRGSPQDQ